MRVIVYLRESKIFCYRITKIMAYDSLAMAETRKEIQSTIEGIKTKFSLNFICNSELSCIFALSLALTEFVDEQR